jgi:hypothetical protein
MNDPRILENTEMMEAPECIREIHAIRLMLQDETEGMTIEEHVEQVNQKGTEILARWGLSHLYAGFPKQEVSLPETAISEPIMA